MSPQLNQIVQAINERGKVLIIEDNSGVSGVLQLLFHQHGIQTALARDGAEGIEMVRSGKFALVMLDVRLPVYNGIEVLKVIKKVSPKTPVILMTAYRDAELIHQAMDMGIVGFISKPQGFSARLVEDIIAQYNLRWKSTPALEVREQVRRHMEAQAGNTQLASACT